MVGMFRVMMTMALLHLEPPIGIIHTVQGIIVLSAHLQCHSHVTVDKVLVQDIKSLYGMPIGILSFR